jgi:hypothetical protein
VIRAWCTEPTSCFQWNLSVMGPCGTQRGFWGFGHHELQTKTSSSSLPATMHEESRREPHQAARYQGLSRRTSWQPEAIASALQMRIRVRGKEK